VREEQITLFMAQPFRQGPFLQRAIFSSIRKMRFRLPHMIGSTSSIAAEVQGEEVFEVEDVIGLVWGGQVNVVSTGPGPAPNCFV